jgi:hypothetical protein
VPLISKCMSVYVYTLVYSENVTITANCTLAKKRGKRKSQEYVASYNHDLGEQYC